MSATWLDGRHVEKRRRDSSPTHVAKAGNLTYLVPRNPLTSGAFWKIPCYPICNTTNRYTNATANRADRPSGDSGRMNPRTGSSSDFGFDKPRRGDTVDMYVQMCRVALFVRRRHRDGVDGCVEDDIENPGFQLHYSIAGPGPRPSGSLSVPFLPCF
ncbi:hypothetical protein DENSPDRAFT_278182 [Dentipellis sp. KUC8613]|nr:hypothetical protein DENSPDRAFT_278182 [Dentipellis sp. KUC8613]